jgi:hypothetical protein
MVSFRVLEALSYALPFLLSVLYLLDSVGPRLAPGLHSLTDGIKLRLGGLILPLLVAILLMVLFNLPLVAKAFRQWRLSRRLTALRLLDLARLPLPRLDAKLLVLFAPVGFLMLFLHTAFAEPIESLPRRAAAVSLLTLWPFALFLIDSLLRRLRGQLQYFEELRALRTRLAAAENAGASLPPDLLIRLADVERIRRLRGNVAALAELQRQENEAVFAVSKSDSAIKTLHGLEDRQRLIVETIIIELASRQDEAVQKAGPPATLHVAGTPWQLIYESDPASRTLHIIAVHPLRDDR